MNVFLTGSTGFVGGELLVTLSKRSEINKIYCLVRSSSFEEALLRLEKVFSLHDDYFDRDKIIPVLGNLFDEHLTQSLKADKALNDIDIIIHSAANTSFSRIYDTMLDRANIHGLEKILLWAKELLHLKTFLYIGTATICGKDIRNRLIAEEESPNAAAQHLVRYTYTKMQGELLLDKHLLPGKILVARPSIIMGDSRCVMPRSPVILWSVATINKLRLIPANEYAALDMIPVDYAARSIIELLFAKRHHRVYHISSGQTAATSAHKLAESLDDYFKGRPAFHFINESLLNQIKLWSKNRLQSSSELYGYTAYLDYWKEIFTDPGELRILLAGLDPYLKFMDLGQVFDNSRLLQDVPSARQSLPADQYIKNCMKFIENIDILEGALDF